MYLIRKADSQDKSSILELTGLLFLQIADFVWNTDGFIDRQISNGEYYLAEKEGKVVGIISFRRRGNKMYIETLAVNKDNQSEGAGKHLIEFAKQFTKGSGLNILCACSFHEYKTVDFYLGQGFSLLEKSGVYNNHQFYRFEMRL